MSWVGLTEGAAIPVTYTYTVQYFANPFLACDVCGVRAEDFFVAPGHDIDRANYPCEHLGMTSVCPSWGIIGSAHQGEWSEATPEWREAAGSWFDEYCLSIATASEPRLADMDANLVAETIEMIQKYGAAGARRTFALLCGDQ